MFPTSESGDGVPGPEPAPPLSLDLSKVNPLYGPGTVLGWYLTILAVIVAWTLHPKRRRSDALDAELVVGLMLPVVAAVHAVILLRRLYFQEASEGESEAEGEAGNATALASAAIEAPLIIVEAGMDFSVPLFLIAAVGKAYKRVAVVMVVGLMCYALEWYLYLSPLVPVGLGQHVFSRRFLADSAVAMAGTAITVGMSVFGSVFFTAVFFAKPLLARWRREEPRVQLPPLASVVQNDVEVEGSIPPPSEQYGILLRRHFRDRTSSE